MSRRVRFVQSIGGDSDLPEDIDWQIFQESYLGPDKEHPAVGQKIRLKGDQGTIELNITEIGPLEKLPNGIEILPLRVDVSG